MQCMQHQEATEHHTAKDGNWKRAKGRLYIDQLVAHQTGSKLEQSSLLCSSCNYSKRCCCYLFISVYTSTIFDLFLTLHQLQVPWHMDYGDAVGTASSALLACYEVRAGNQSLKQNAIWRSGSASGRFFKGFCWEYMTRCFIQDALHREKLGLPPRLVANTPELWPRIHFVKSWAGDSISGSCKAARPMALDVRATRLEIRNWRKD